MLFLAAEDTSVLYFINVESRTLSLFFGIVLWDKLIESDSFVEFYSILDSFVVSFTNDYGYGVSDTP